MTTNSRVGIEQVLLDGAHVVVLVPENRSFDSVPMRLMACEGQSPIPMFQEHRSNNGHGRRRDDSLSLTKSATHPDNECKE
jgi:hypothetical protein